MLDSEIGQRDIMKNRPDVQNNRNRLVKTGMGNKAAAYIGDMMNSGKSIVMSKVHKVASPGQADDQNKADGSADEQQ